MSQLDDIEKKRYDSKGHLLENVCHVSGVELWHDNGWLIDKLREVQKIALDEYKYAVSADIMDKEDQGIARTARKILNVLDEKEAHNERQSIQ